MTVSIWNLRPLERPPVSRHFTDAEQPAWEGVTLTLAPMDGVRATRFAKLAADLKVKHITGLRGPDGELVKGADGKPTQPPEPVRCQDFSRRTPDEIVIDRYAKLAAMWASDEPCPPLSEMVGWQALLYEGWLQIANWIEDIYTGGLEGNAKGAPATPNPETEAASEAVTDSSSEPSSSITANTPSSPHAETPCLPASNGGSGRSSTALEPPVEECLASGRADWTQAWP